MFGVPDFSVPLSSGAFYLSFLLIAIFSTAFLFCLSFSFQYNEDCKRFILSKSCKTFISAVELLEDEVRCQLSYSMNTDLVTLIH